MNETTARRPLGSQHLPDAAVPWIRRLARAWGGFGILAWMLWRIGEGVPAAGELGFAEASVEITLWTVAVVGYILAVIELEITGATITAAAGATLALWEAQFHDPAFSLAILAIFFGPAALYWLIWQRNKPAWEVASLGAALVVIVGGVTVAAMQINDALLGPTHPSSSASDPELENVEWVWSGGISTEHAEVRARVTPGAEARLAVSLSEDLSQPTWHEGRPASEEDRGLVRFEVDDLAAASTYHYAVEVNGELDSARRGEFSTFGEGSWSFSIAAGSCARVGSNGAVFDTIRKLEPDLFIEYGDLFYADISTNDRNLFRQYFDGVFAEPGPSSLYRSTATDYVWDDHDFGPNDANSTSNSRPAAQSVYREVVPHPPLVRDGQEAVYHAFTMGRARVIVTDTRSERSPQSDPDGPQKTMLGSDQLEWFLDELAAADERYPLIIWVNSVPWIAEKEAGADHWGGYDHERRTIADFIASEKIDGILMLAGDAHMVAIDNGTNSDYSSAGGAGFPVLHGAALDRPGTGKGGPYSEGSFPGSGQFSTVDVDDDGDDVRVTLTGRRWDGKEIVTYSYSLDGVEESRLQE